MRYIYLQCWGEMSCAVGSWDAHQIPEVPVGLLGYLMQLKVPCSLFGCLSPRSAYYDSTLCGSIQYDSQMRFYDLQPVRQPDLPACSWCVLGLQASAFVLPMSWVAC